MQCSPVLLNFCLALQVTQLTLRYPGVVVRKTEAETCPEEEPEDGQAAEEVEHVVPFRVLGMYWSVNHFLIFFYLHY